MKYIKFIKLPIVYIYILSNAYSSNLEKNVIGMLTVKNNYKLSPNLFFATNKETSDQNQSIKTDDDFRNSLKIASLFSSGKPTLLKNYKFQEQDFRMCGPSGGLSLYLAANQFNNERLILATGELLTNGDIHSIGGAFFKLLQIIVLEESWRKNYSSDKIPEVEIVLPTANKEEAEYAFNYCQHYDKKLVKNIRLSFCSSLLELETLKSSYRGQKLNLKKHPEFITRDFHLIIPSSFFQKESRYILTVTHSNQLSKIKILIDYIERLYYNTEIDDKNKQHNLNQLFTTLILTGDRSVLQFILAYIYDKIVTNNLEKDPLEKKNFFLEFLNQYIMRISTLINQNIEEKTSNNIRKLLQSSAGRNNLYLDFCKTVEIFANNLATYFIDTKKILTLNNKVNDSLYRMLNKVSTLKENTRKIFKEHCDYLIDLEKLFDNWEYKAHPDYTSKDFHNMNLSPVEKLQKKEICEKEICEEEICEEEICEEEIKKYEKYQELIEQTEIDNLLINAVEIKSFLQNIESFVNKNIIEDILIQVINKDPGKDMKKINYTFLLNMLNEKIAKNNSFLHLLYIIDFLLNKKRIHLIDNPYCKEGLTKMLRECFNNRFLSITESFILLNYLCFNINLLYKKDTTNPYHIDNFKALKIQQTNSNSEHHQDILENLVEKAKENHRILLVDLLQKTIEGHDGNTPFNWLVYLIGVKLLNQDEYNQWDFMKHFIFSKNLILKELIFNDIFTILFGKNHISDFNSTDHNKIQFEIDTLKDFSLELQLEYIKLLPKTLIGFLFLITWLDDIQSNEYVYNEFNTTNKMITMENQYSQSIDLKADPRIKNKLITRIAEYISEISKENYKRLAIDCKTINNKSIKKWYFSWIFKQEYELLFECIKKKAFFTKEDSDTNCEYFFDYEYAFGSEYAMKALYELLFNDITKIKLHKKQEINYKYHCNKLQQGYYLIKEIMRIDHNSKDELPEDWNKYKKLINDLDTEIMIILK